MKVTIFALVALYAHSVLASERLVPEAVILSWGYETIEHDAMQQRIKGIKGVRASETEMYYPRLTLRKTCFESDQVAAAEDSRIREQHDNEPFGGAKSHYDSFVNGSCLYSISTAARVTYLDYQPRVFGKYRAFVVGRAELCGKEHSVKAGVGQ